ncbi:hypothetical protein C8029_19990 [Roseobacter sp. TSBP12]|nr:hypothetical protein C8029_19990 [Roseobacter sp. TSBP12]
MCVIRLAIPKKTVEASAFGAVHPGVERNRQAVAIASCFMHRADSRPSASYDQCNPVVVEHRLQPVMTAQNSVSGKARTITGWDSRDEAI